MKLLIQKLIFDIYFNYCDCVDKIDKNTGLTKTIAPKAATAAPHHNEHEFVTKSDEDGKDITSIPIVRETIPILHREINIYM